jgi:hypothetical protein
VTNGYHSVGKNPNRRVSKAGRPLTIRAIVIGGILMAVVGAVAVSALLHFYGGGTDRDRAGFPGHHEPIGQPRSVVVY